MEKGKGHDQGKDRKSTWMLLPMGKKKSLELLRDRQQILPHPGHRSRPTVAWKMEKEKTLYIWVGAGNIQGPGHKISFTTEGGEGSLKDLRCSDTEPT